MTDQTPVLRLEGIVKTFPGVRALDGVVFSSLNFMYINFTN